MFYVAGPGHGGPALVSNVYLEGTWSETYPDITQDNGGMTKLFKQFSSLPRRKVTTEKYGKPSLVIDGQIIQEH